MSRELVVYSPDALQTYGHCHDYVRGLGGRLAALGWDVHVVAWEGPLALPDPLRAAGVPRPDWWSLPRSRFRRYSALIGDVIYGLVRIQSERRLIAALEEALRARPEAAVLYESFEYVGLARHLRRERSDRSRVTIVHDAGFNTQHASPVAAAYKSLVRRQVRAIVARSTTVLVHGPHMKRALEANVGLASTLAERVGVIPYGAPSPREVSLSEPGAARAQLGIAATGRLALAFGTLRRDKRFDFVLKGLARAPGWSLLVAGPEGDLSYDAFLAQAARAGVADRVVLHRGFVGPERHALYFGAADIVLAVYDSRIRHESGTGQLSRTFLRPVIACGGPDLEAYVRETGCGWVADSDDASSLAAALQAFDRLDETGIRDLRRRIEEAADARSWQAVAVRVDALLRPAAPRDQA